MKVAGMPLLAWAWRAAWACWAKKAFAPSDTGPSEEAATRLAGAVGFAPRPAQAVLGVSGCKTSAIAKVEADDKSIRWSG